MPKRSSTSRNLNEIANRIVGESTSDAPITPPEKNAAAVALGRLGGLVGGKARAAALSKKRRAAIAKKAARARWKNK